MHIPKSVNGEVEGEVEGEGGRNKECERDRESRGEGGWGGKSVWQCKWPHWWVRELQVP